MASATIILERNPKTGKQNVIVKMNSDPDALPIEHETAHKKIVEKLLGKGLRAEDIGDITIERDSEGDVKITTESEGKQEKISIKSN